MYLLNDNPHIAINGCVCHSAHLIAAAASQEIPNNIEALLQNISNYFSRSPKRQSVLQEFQNYMHASQLKILSPSQTRWLALSNCVKRLLNQWDVLVEVFRLAAFEEKNSVANLILNEMQNPYVKAYLYFLKHILPVFNSFNSMFQSQKILVDKLYMESRRFVRLLCVNFVKSSFYVNDNELDTLNVFNPHVLLPIEEINFGSDTMDLLKDCDKNDTERFKLRCLKFYQNAVDQAFKRLPVRDTFYKSLAFVLPENALNLNFQHDMTDVLKKFDTKIDFDKAKREYNNLKVYFSEQEKNDFLKCENILEFWTKLSKLKNFDEEYPFKNVSTLALIILVLTHGNADVERVFSMVTDVKTKKRNRLLTDTLSDVIRIKLDMAAWQTCCTNYPTNNNHFKFFNKFMYTFKTSATEEAPTSDSDAESF